MEKKTLTIILKELEDEYIEIWSANVEFKKGYQGYDNYKAELYSQFKEHVLALLKPDPLDSVGTVQTKRQLQEDFLKSL